MTYVQTAVPYVPVTGGTFTGPVNFGPGHWHGISTVVRVVASAGAGTGAPAPVVTTGSTDLAGSLTWGTGSAPSTQTQLAITYGRPWTIPGGGAPHCVITPGNAATQALGLFLTSQSPTGFNLSVANAPAANQPASTYAFNYIVVG